MIEFDFRVGCELAEFAIVDYVEVVFREVCPVKGYFDPTKIHDKHLRVSLLLRDIPVGDHAQYTPYDSPKLVFQRRSVWPSLLTPPRQDCHHLL